MAVEALSGAVYHDTARLAAKPRVETTTGQVTSATSINIEELPSVSRVVNTNQTGSGQNNTQNNKGQTNTQSNGQINGQTNGLKTGEAYEQQIKDALSKVNNKLVNHRTRCEFSYHEETKRVSIKVIDKDTEQVIREIPPEQTLEMVQKMWELAGFLVDEKR